MQSNLPATRDVTATGIDERPPIERRQPIGVALLPLALVTFILLALVIAAWTFLAAST